MVWRSSVSVTLLECALRKNAPATPLECAVTKLLDLKSRGISSYKKCGGGVTNVEGGGRLTFRPQRRPEIRRAGRKSVGCGNCCGVVTTRSQSRTCTPTVWRASSRCVSDSAGERSGCGSAAHSTWVTPATGLRFWRLWRLLICMRMAMPRNTRAGLGIGGVLPVLFAWYKLTGPHEIRKPFWALAGENSVNLSEEGQGEIP